MNPSLVATDWNVGPTDVVGRECDLNCRRAGRLAGRAKIIFSVPMASVVVLLLMAGGCTGHAVIHTVPVGPKAINTTGALIVEVAPDECYYWLNDDGELCLAMRSTKRSILGRRFEREFLLSLVLDAPPAGSARHYRVFRRTLRGRHRAGSSHTRCASLSGMAVVWDYGNGRLHGRLRVTAKQQSYMVLTGWGRDRRVLLVGEFAAVNDRAAGETIFAWTEEEGMSRRPRRGVPFRVQTPARASQPADD